MIFGDKCVRIVDGVPTGANTASGNSSPSPPTAAVTTGSKATTEDGNPVHASSIRNTRGSGEAATSSRDNPDRGLGSVHAGTRRCWFSGVVSLPALEDRVWDARLIGGGDDRDGNATNKSDELPNTGVRGEQEEDEGREDGRRRARRSNMAMVAVALAHNSVEVCARTTVPARVGSWRRVNIARLFAVL